MAVINEGALEIVARNVPEEGHDLITPVAVEGRRSGGGDFPCLLEQHADAGEGEVDDGDAHPDVAAALEGF